jgi:hypothetical protein
MATKAELEACFHRYLALKADMVQAQKAGLYQPAINIAVSSFDYVDGMMQFDRKYRGQTEYESVETIDFVLKYAPLLFDHESLDKIEVLLKAQRRIEKNTSANLAELLTEARATMWSAYHFWEYIEQTDTVSLNTLKKDGHPRWKSIAKDWEKIGLVSRRGDADSEIALTTRLEDKVRGKCPSCGAIGMGAKAKLLELITCPRCKKSVCFVILNHQIV